MGEKHNKDVEQVHHKEAGSISEVHERLLKAATHGDNHQMAGSSADLKLSVSDWEKQFATLPQKDGKLDTARFSEKDWQQAHEMYTELNKPGGRIDQVANIAREAKTALTGAETNLQYSNA